MAKPQQLENTRTALTTVEEEALARQYAGAGVSTKAADNIVPQVRILQPLSPEIVESKVPGAKPGDFLMGTDVMQDFWFQPCFWDQRWFEFMPLSSGGGFVSSHEWVGETRNGPIPPKGATKVDDFRFKMGDNELVHYRQWAGLAWIDKRPLERTINFKSTGHTVARQWNNKAREANRLSDGTIRPLFGHVYHLTTERITNAKGTWYQLQVGNPVLLSQAKDIVGEDWAKVAALGNALNQAFTGGERKAEVDTKAEETKSDTF